MATPVGSSDLPLSHAQVPAVPGAPTTAPSALPVGVAVGPLGAVQAADREMARQAALRARAVAEFAASRPATADRAQGEPGAMSVERWAARPQLLREVSEWAAQELVVALSISTEAAEKLLHRSLTLVHRLPRTLEALEKGALHEGHLWPMLEKVGPIEESAVRAEVEERLLTWAAGRVTTPAQLGANARREVLTRDARGAAQRLARAIKERGIHLRPEGTEGMATVTAVLTMPEALALHRALGALADALADDPADPRTRGQKMADCLLDLVLRPGQAHGVSVQLLLTVVASLGTVAGGDEPGEIDGHVVPAETIRHLLQACAGHSGGRTTGPEPCAPAPASSAAPGEAPDGMAEQPDLTTDQAELEALERWWAEVERRAAAGEFDEPEPIPDDVLLRWALEAGQRPPGEQPDPLPASDRDRFGQSAPDWWSTADRGGEGRRRGDRGCRRGGRPCPPGGAHGGGRR